MVNRRKISIIGAGHTGGDFSIHSCTKGVRRYCVD
ncbi:hypothetical protein HMPREF9995_03055 [Staphylococcus epidermidis NIHLM095]|nr:hypothetical protein HMPREF9995_03055 [Staphylococcus epidermidis NIHLM095]